MAIHSSVPGIHGTRHTSHANIYTYMHAGKIPIHIRRESKSLKEGRTIIYTMIIASSRFEGISEPRIKHTFHPNEQAPV